MAVDLAGWIVQSNQCKAMNNKVHRPYLRNIFFRAAAMQSLNIYVRVSKAVQTSVGATSLVQTEKVRKSNLFVPQRAVLL